MEAIGSSLTALFDVCFHMKKRSNKQIHWSKILLILSVLGGWMGYVVHTIIRCTKSYENPIYEGQVALDDEILFPTVYICTTNRFLRLQSDLCVIDQDWSFDPSSFQEDDGVRCSVREEDVPASVLTGDENKFRNWTCAVFNNEGTLNASRSADGFPVRTYE